MNAVKLWDSREEAFVYVDRVVGIRKTDIRDGKHDYIFSGGSCRGTNWRIMAILDTGVEFPLDRVLVGNGPQAGYMTSAAVDKCLEYYVAKLDELRGA